MPVRKVCIEFWQPSCLSALTMPRWQPRGLRGANGHLSDSMRVAVPGVTSKSQALLEKMQQSPTCLCYTILVTQLFGDNVVSEVIANQGLILQVPLVS